MTKVGDGKTPPKVPTVADAHKNLDQAALKFENALISYQSSGGDDKTRLKQIMDQQLALIQAAIREIQRAGVATQGQKVASDYQKYMSNGSVENYAALEQDIETLREYNRLP